MTIGILGLGYVGLTLAIAAAKSGITVYGIDTNPYIKECLAKNKAHFFEPGLDLLIEQFNDNRFYFVDAFPKNINYDAFIITVGTPLVKGQKLPNFEYIQSATRSLRGVYSGKELIVLRSTVSVGTTRNIVLPVLSKLSNIKPSEVLLSMCPERTIEGKAIDELTNLPQIISGNNDESLELAKKLFSRITSRVIPVASLEEAELVKLYCNVYRDTMFAVGNVFCIAAQEFGVDGTSVIRAANDGYPRSNIALPGFVAGPCLEKDAYLLSNNMPDCPARDFILSERHFNESLEDMVVDWVERNSKCNVIALSGMAFKGVPETSDLRGSSSVYIAQKLIAKGYMLRLHDFVAIPDELAALGIGDVCGSVDEACAGASALLILNNCRRYSELTVAKTDIPILDAWNVCTKVERKSTLGNIRLEGAK